MQKKYVYLFSEGNGKMRELLGGKGANLAEMTNLGMPVPQGFTIKMCIRDSRNPAPDRGENFHEKVPARFPLGANLKAADRPCSPRKKALVCVSFLRRFEK